MNVEKELHQSQSAHPEVSVQVHEPQSSAPPSEPATAQLIQLAEREAGAVLARDLNRKLDELEGQLGLLNRHFDDSRQVLESNLDALRTFHQQLTSEIESTRQQLSAQSANHDAATKALDTRLQAAQVAMKAQLGQTAEVLGTELQRLQSLHEQLDIAHAKTGSDLVSLSLSTRKNVRWLTGGLGAVAALTLAGMLTLQFFPTAVPLSVSEQLDGLQGRVNGHASDIGGLQAALDQAREQLTSLEQGVQFNGEADAIRNGQTTRQLVGLTDALGQLQRQMDDLQYRVMGPINPAPGATMPLVPLQDRAWVDARPADHYSIQLVGVNDQQRLTNFINQNAHVLKDQPIFFNQGTHLGRPWFNLFYGDYAGLNDAQQALQSLPLRLRGNSPWVRPIASIR
ncbi:MAG: SPOR domain-containing protein [Hahellaceae bacterium]|nr:SPOR domain-containing protein [Hahellaceae bacterium]